MAAVALPNLERLSSRVVRVLGLNPGPFTLQGTNTYLVGKGRQRILIDTGEGKPDYPALLKKSLEGCEIKHVILTHYHYDHVNGIPDVCRMQPNAAVWKMPCATHDKEFTVDDGVASRAVPIRALKDQDTLSLAEEDGEDTTLRVVHTPGHTADHLALYLDQEKAVFSGDCVLGGSSAVFENLYDYMKSLARLIDLAPGRIYPGHGPVIEQGTQVLEEYVAHRNERERQIVACIRSGGDSRPWTAMDIVKVVYAATPEHLHKAAESNVLHHLQKLEKQGDVVAAGDANGAQRWKSRL